MRRNKNYVNLSVQLRPKGQNPNNKNMNTETLEEAAVLSSAVHFERTICSDGFYKTYQTGFKEGAKWMQERMYSEEDIKLAFEHGILFSKESVSLCKEAINTEYELFIQNIKNQTK